MANFLSKPPSTATKGERLFYNRIESVFAEENHLIGYFEPYIGNLHPDFVLISPKFGIIIAEIKDYSEKYLTAAPKSGKWESLKDERLRLFDNPFDQLYQYWRAIKDRVNHCQFPKELDIPIIRLVIFTHISKDNPIAEEIRRNTPSKIHLIFKEILNRNTAFKEFVERLLPKDFQLSDKDFELFRGNIIPTSRLPTLKQADLMEYFSVQDRIKLLDQEQERIARELGKGHRLLFGVAGSGKTIVLIARARILAKQHPDWKILILCYNRLLKKMLLQLLNPQDYDADITISTFHGWVKRYIMSANNNYSYQYTKTEQEAKNQPDMNDFFQNLVPNLFLQMLEALGDKKVHYDAILIDEAQDFEAEWFRPIIQVLNPKTNSLLITCDGLQGIYARKRFYWSDVGIQARGRVKRFEKSYRTPIEIGFLAQETLPQTLKELIGQFEEFVPTKEFIGTHGTVEILISNTRDGEYRKLAKEIIQLQKNPQDILVLFKQNIAKRDYQHPFCDCLKDFNIEWKDLQKYNFKSSGLLIGTLHGTKGLESDTVIIPEVDTYISDKDRQLLYVGITRSRKKLILSANKSTKLIKSLEPYQT